MDFPKVNPKISIPGKLATPMDRFVGKPPQSQIMGSLEFWNWFHALSNQENKIVVLSSKCWECNYSCTFHYFTTLRPFCCSISRHDSHGSTKIRCPSPDLRQMPAAVRLDAWHGFGTWKLWLKSSLFAYVAITFSINIQTKKLPLKTYYIKNISISSISSISSKYVNIINIIKKMPFSKRMKKGLYSQGSKWQARRRPRNSFATPRHWKVPMGSHLVARGCRSKVGKLWQLWQLREDTKRGLSICGWLLVWLLVWKGTGKWLSDLGSWSKKKLLAFNASHTIV